MKLKHAHFPYVVWTALFIAIPLGLIIYYAFTDHFGNFTLNYIRESGEYAPIILKSIRLAGISTLICLVCGFPVAYIISRSKKINERTLLLVLMLPMWMNFLLRTDGWLSILENNGIINQFLSLLHLPGFNMINTQGAVILGMVYNYIPFMILPLHSIMSKIGTDILEAAQDLGANSYYIFKRVILPISIPGIKTGITMVFVPSVSTFIISQMLGGSTNQLVGDIIELQFLGNTYNPHLGSAISIALMVIVLLMMGLMGFFDDEDLGGNLI